MPRIRVLVYGSGAAVPLLATYSDNADRAAYVARQSLISAMNGASGISLSVPSDLSPAASRVLMDDVQSSLTDELAAKSGELDCVLWDLADERFGVLRLADGTYLTASPQLSKASMRGAEVTRHVSFGTREHFALWKSAADRFIDLLGTLGLRSRTFVLKMPAASHSPKASGAKPRVRGYARAVAYARYYRHLRRRGIAILDANPKGARYEPTPGNVDQRFHLLAAKLGAAMEQGGYDNSGHWNWDAQHQATVLCWSDPSQLDVRITGRTEHLIVPRDRAGEKYPIRFLLQNTGADTLLVVSHGALARTKYKVPRFEFLSTLQSRNENLLFLSDGVLEVNPKLELAWFTGDAKDDLTVRYSRIVRTVAEQLGAKKILFVGGSGGGFASVNLAASVEGSRALVFNPQTDIRKYWAKSVLAYQRTLFPELDSPDELCHLEERASLVHRVSSLPPESYQLIYVQNDDDTFHIENHLKPFAKQLGMYPSTSVSPNGNVQIIVEPFASGHSMPYRSVLNPLIDYALQGWGQKFEPWKNRTHALPVPPEL